ncbi:MAG TPA: PEP-CTERM sorting domain-containing protein [Verrucomicrobiae bacterium]
MKLVIFSNAPKRVDCSNDCPQTAVVLVNQFWSFFIMKRMLTLLVWLSTMMAIVPTLLGQGFINLNFEAAKIIFNQNSGFIATSNALPGWSFFLGTNQLSAVDYNDYAVAHTSGLVGSNSLVLNGNFSASVDGNDSISQTGLIPNGSESLLFNATSSSFLVSLGGVNLSYATISTGANSFGQSYSVYAANISGFAGQTETLTFSSPSGIYAVLDNIQFSPVAIPEPSAISLIFLGGGALIYVRTRNKRRSKPASLD